MFSSESSANANKDSNFFFPNRASFKNEDSHFQQSEQSIGLARYRSAPSSFLAALLDNDDNGGDEAEALMFSSFFNGSNTNGAAADSPDLNKANHSPNHDGGGNNNSSSLKQGRVDGRHQMGPYESAVNGGGGAVVGSYTMGMEGDAISNKVNSSSSLARQSSSPAGLFNGFSVMGDAGSYRVHNQGEASSSSANRLSNLSSYSSNSRASSYMPSIPENRSDSVVAQRSENLRSSDGRDSWNNALKRGRDGDLKMFSDFSILDSQSGENGRRSNKGLVHHLSLPKTASEMAASENFLHFQHDSIQIRAKRGCATHPRSIAERVRRTKISEKMKKLQDLFPNLDKQTNTADMLDMAVEYIKELQNQVQSLTESKAKCVCPNKPRESSTAA